jgi:hypothetical protein
MTSDKSTLDVVQTGKGRDLVLLHSLLSDRTAFDRIAPRLANERRVWLVNCRASAPRRRPGLASTMLPTASPVNCRSSLAARRRL